MSPVAFVLFPDKVQLIVIFPPSSTVVMFGQTLMILSIKLEDKKNNFTANLKYQASASKAQDYATLFFA